MITVNKICQFDNNLSNPSVPYPIQAKYPPMDQGKIDPFGWKRQDASSGKCDEAGGGSLNGTEEITNNGIINYAGGLERRGVHTIGSLIFSDVPIDFLSRGLCQRTEIPWSATTTTTTANQNRDRASA